VSTRAKFQRPTVYATGKREKLWRVEYRQYFIDAAGKEYSRHKSRTWSRANFTKAQAQAEADKLLLELQQGGPKADGSMSLRAFYESVYLPIRSRHWSGNTPVAVANLWRNHIEPRLGHVALESITKAAIQLHLCMLADYGLGQSMVDAVRVRLFSILEEAVDNDYLPRNVARKIETPPCKEPEETRSLTEAEVQALWDGTTGRDYLVWRVLILTGARIGEVLALERADIRPDGLMIDEAIVGGTIKLPKRNKTRLASMADSLRAELAEWLASHECRLIFPSERGHVYRRSAKQIEEILERGRAIIPGVTFRQCRTTFASLFQGDEADRTSIMGHFSTAFTLERYRKPIMERRQVSVEELDKRLRKVTPIKKIC
jgi:integrase